MDVIDYGDGDYDARAKRNVSEYVKRKQAQRHQYKGHDGRHQERVNERIHRLHTLRKDKKHCPCAHCVRFRKEAPVNAAFKKSWNDTFKKSLLHYGNYSIEGKIRAASPPPVPGFISTLEEAEKACRRVRFGAPWDTHFTPHVGVSPHLFIYERTQAFTFQPTIQLTIYLNTRDRVTGGDLLLRNDRSVKLGQTEEEFFKEVRACFHEALTHDKRRFDPHPRPIPKINLFSLDAVDLYPPDIDPDIQPKLNGSLPGFGL
jgi:hypothetical protein